MNSLTDTEKEKLSDDLLNRFKEFEFMNYFNDLIEQTQYQNQN